MTSEIAPQKLSDHDDSGSGLSRGTELHGGRFIVERALNHGTGGSVYVAFDQQRGERVALKLLAQQDGSSLFRLKQEFRALADVVHPNVVRLYELFGEHDYWYFTMELIDGSPPYSASTGAPRKTTLETTPSSDSFDRTKRRINEHEIKEVRQWLTGLVPGLRAIHDAGKVHCDLKPSNVLVTDANRVVIVDFGLVLDTPTAPARPDSPIALGTPAYVAPEVVLGQEPTPASDWYGVGVMIYEALFGVLPFDGSASDILREKVRREAPSPPIERADTKLIQLCLGLLARNPERRLGPSEVEEWLGTPTPSRPSWIPPSDFRTIFVGRKNELRTIEKEFRRSRREGPRIILVPGDSGMGKSALLAAACDRIEGLDSRAWVLRSSCYERENLPFKALDRAVDGLRAKLERLSAAHLESLLPDDAELLPLLFPVFSSWSCFGPSGSGPALNSSDNASDDLICLRAAAFRALGELMASIAEEVPLVLVLDDLQWMDMGSLRLLSEILALRAPPRLLVLGSYRSDAHTTSPPLRTLLRTLDDLRLPRKTLPALELNAQDAEDLVRSVSGEVSHVALKKIVSETHGFPYFILQLAHQQKLGGTIEHSSLETILRDQIDSLNDDAHTLLRAIALSPAPVTSVILSNFVARDLDMGRVLHDLHREHLVRFLQGGSNSRVDLYHDRVRSVVLHGLVSSERQEAHGRLADAWIQHRDSDPEIIFHHLKAAGRKEESGIYALRSAKAAEEKLAFERAAQCHEEALHILEPTGEEGIAMLADWARCLGAAGEGPKAAEVYVLAARRSRGDEATKLRWRATEQLLQSRSEDGSFLLEVFRELGLNIPSPTMRSLRIVAEGMKCALSPGLRIPRVVTGPRNEAKAETFDRLFTAGMGMMFGGDLDLCIYLLVEATRLGLASGEPGRVACACALRIEAELHTKGIAKQVAAEKLLQVRRLLDQSKDPSIEAYGHLVLGQSYYAAACLSEALVEFKMASECFSAIPGRKQMADAAQTSLSFMRLLQGDVSHAGLLGSSLMVQGEARGQPFFRKAGHVDLAVLCLTQGRIEAARAHIDELIESPQDISSWFGVMFLHFGSMLGAYDSRFRVSYQSFENADSQIRSMAHRHHYRPWLLVGKGITLLDLLATKNETRVDLERSASLTIVSQIARELRKSSGIRVLVPYGMVLEAARRHLNGQPSQSLLNRAEQLFEEHGAFGYAHMTRRVRGLSMGPQAGADLIIDAADAALHKLGVVDPARLSSAYFPGFLPTPS